MPSCWPSKGEEEQMCHHVKGVKEQREARGLRPQPDSDSMPAAAKGAPMGSVLEMPPYQSVSSH